MIFFNKIVIFQKMIKLKRQNYCVWVQKIEELQHLHENLKKINANMKINVCKQMHVLVDKFVI